MKKIIFSVLVLSILSLLLLSCGKDSIECDGSTPTYESDIKIIINDNCTSCHSYRGDATSPGWFTDYDGLSEVISNGQFEAKVLASKSMPKNSKLTNTEMQLIRCWVDNGYPEN